MPVARRLERERLVRELGSAEEVQRAGRHGRGVPPGQRRKHRTAVAVAPQQAGAGTRRLGRERRHLVGRPRLLRGGGERVAGQLERVGRRPRHRRRGKGPAGQLDLARRRPGQPQLALVEGIPAPHQLERADHTGLVPHRQLQDA